MNSLSKYSNSYMTLLMLVIFTTLVLVATRYPAGARFMPFVIGFPAIALCILQLFLDARERRRAERGAAEEAGLSDLEKAELKITQAVGHQVHFDANAILMPEEHKLEPREQLRREGIAWGYFLALIGGIILFGFHIAVPVFLLTFLRFRAQTSWIAAIGSAIGASIVLFAIFEYTLRIDLFSGFVTERFQDMMGMN